jgi:hypothetical protein
VKFCTKKAGVAGSPSSDRRSTTHAACLHGRSVAPKTTLHLAAGNILFGMRALLDTSRMERRVAPLVGGVLLKIDTNRHPVIVARLMAIQLRTMDGQSAISLAERAISLLERDGDRRGTILIMRNQSALHLTRGNLAKAQAAINRAFVFAAEQGLQRSRLFANLLVMRCTTRCYAGQLDKARSDLAELELPDADIGVEKSSLLMAQCVIAFFEGSYRRAADIIEASIGEAV